MRVIHLAAFAAWAVVTFIALCSLGFVRAAPVAASGAGGLVFPNTERLDVRFLPPLTCGNTGGARARRGRSAAQPWRNRTINARLTVRIPSNVEDVRTSEEPLGLTPALVGK